MTSYLTYFDRNYIARGVVMINSLLAVLPEARILAFAMDDETETILRRLYGQRIQLLPPDFVNVRWPMLDRMRTERKHWEYLAGRKPCLIHSVLSDLIETNELLFYVDADTQFFARPDPAFVFMTNASIGISPHGFSARHARLVALGEFNAGFMIIRNDSIGQTCINDWADDCLEWCCAQDDNGQWMNQGYLTKWPSRYSDVAILDHPGLNLAPWNVDGQPLTSKNDDLYVSGERLVFYHFHGVNRQEGRWGNFCPLVSPEAHANLFEKIYNPYLRLLGKTDVLLACLGFDVNADHLGKYDPAA